MELSSGTMENHTVCLIKHVLSEVMYHVSSSACLCLLHVYTLLLLDTFGNGAYLQVDFSSSGVSVCLFYSGLNGAAFKRC